MIKIAVSWDKDGEGGRTRYEMPDDFPVSKLLRELMLHADKAFTYNEILIKERHPNPPNPDEDLPCVL